MRLRDALPSFYSELVHALTASDPASILEQLPELEMAGRCSCPQPDCATFYVSPSRGLNVVEANVVGVRHGSSTPLEVDGHVVIDTDNFGRVTMVEVLGRPDVAEALRQMNLPRDDAVEQQDEADEARDG